MAGLTRIVTGTDFNAANYNGNQDAHERGNLKAIGRGILSGLDLTDDGGLTLGIASGVLMGRCAKAIDAQTYEVPDDATSYIWIDEDGAITTSASSADPGGYVSCLGRVVAASGNITTVETYGRMSAFRQTGIRVFQIGESLLYVDTLNNWVGVGKTPATDLDVDGTTTVVDLSVTADAVVAGKVKTSSRLELVEVGSDPDAVGNSCMLYAKDVGGVTELFWRDSAGNVRQLTNAGVLSLGGLSTSNVSEGSNLYYTDERVDDRVNALLVEGSGIDVSYNDGANTLTLTKVQGTQHEPDPANSETISATKTLTTSDKNVQALVASGGNQDVKLPSAPSGYGDWFRIMNVGGSNNIVLKSNSGGTTIVNLAPGERVLVLPVVNAGVPAWPSSLTAEGMGGGV